MAVPDIVSGPLLFMQELREQFSSPAEADSSYSQGRDARAAMAGIVEGNRRVRQLGRELVRRIYRQERQLDATTILMLDRYSTALRKMTDAAECAVHHLRLMIPSGGVGA